MKAPVGLLSNRTVLRQQDGGASPRQVPVGASEVLPCIPDLTAQSPSPFLRGEGLILYSMLICTTGQTRRQYT